MPKMEDPAARLERYLEERRLALDMEWTDLAKAAGIPTETLLQVRRGGIGANRSLTRKAVEVAVGWSVGDIEKIRAGGEPTVRSDGVSQFLTFDEQPEQSHDAAASATDEAIRNDPTLNQEARQHLLNQLRLLRLLPPEGERTTVGEPPPSPAPSPVTPLVRPSGQPPRRAAALPRRRDPRKPPRGEPQP